MRTPPPHGQRLRWLGRALAVLIATFLSHHSWAGVRVPLSLQAQLVGRLGNFDRHFADRAGPVARVLVVYKEGVADSKVDATAFARALSDLGAIGGIPVHIEETEVTDGAALAQRTRNEHLALVYLSSGLENDMPRIAAAFRDVDALTVGASAQHAERGAVVGFDLEEARPKIVLNMKSARAQHVAFKAELMKLARILE